MTAKFVNAPAPAGSVDSLIGKLRVIYNRLGRFGHVNPVSRSLIKEYLKFTREEQAGLAVTPKQAVPLFFNLYVQNSRLEMQKRSFSRLGVRLWNEIPCHMRDLPKKMFKRVLRTSLLIIFQKEDDYIHIPEIIKKVGEVD